MDAYAALVEPHTRRELTDRVPGTLTEGGFRPADGTDRTVWPTPDGWYTWAVLDTDGSVLSMQPAPWHHTSTSGDTCTVCWRPALVTW